MNEALCFLTSGRLLQCIARRLNNTIYNIYHNIGANAQRHFKAAILHSAEQDADLRHFKTAILHSAEQDADLRQHDNNTPYQTRNTATTTTALIIKEA